MQRAMVIGHAVATAKHASMEGFRLLVVQPLGPAERPDGDPLLVLDTHGGRPGAVVLITSDGKAARQLVGTDKTPVRYFTFGIEDPSGQG